MISTLKLLAKRKGKRKDKMVKKKLAKVGEYRTIVPKKGVYIHVKKKVTGKMSAERLRRTIARAKKTRKPRVQRLPTKRKRG